MSRVAVPVVLTPSPLHSPAFGAFEPWTKLISVLTTSVANLLRAHFKHTISTASVGLVCDYIG